MDWENPGQLDNEQTVESRWPKRRQQKGWGEESRGGESVVVLKLLASEVPRIPGNMGHSHG